MSFDPAEWPEGELDERDHEMMAALERGLDLLAHELRDVPGIGDGVLLAVFEGEFRDGRVRTPIFGAWCRPKQRTDRAARACESAAKLFARAGRPQG